MTSKMKNKQLYIIALTLTLIWFVSCNNKTEETKSPLTDTLKIASLTRPYPTGSDVSGDSDKIYGTGDFAYHDSLESYHRGYSIPRDSAYKVWNTNAFLEYDRMIRKHPLIPVPYLDRGNHFQNIKMFREAISDYNQYIRLYPKNPSAYMNRGNAYERLKVYDSAMWDYSKTLELKPNDTIANFNKGNIYDIRGQYDLAVKEYDTTIMKDPRLAKAYYNRGTSYLNLKNYDLAIKDWETAIKLNPPYEPDLGPRISRIRQFIK
jgi:tetratricopeptide (TPR) repeat protein